jgi:hypothetical protein
MKTQKAMKRDFIAGVTALLMALAVIFFVKYYIIEHQTAASDKDLILYLELGACLLVFSSFALAEVLRAFQYIFKTMNHTRAQIGSANFLTLLLTVFISLCIYFSFVRLAAS